MENGTATLGKDEAISLLGGSQAIAARRMGISKQAVFKWPDPLPSRIAQRVLGVVYLHQQSQVRDEPMIVDGGLRGR